MVYGAESVFGSNVFNYTGKLLPRDQNYIEKILQAEAHAIIIQLIPIVTKRHAGTKQC